MPGGEPSSARHEARPPSTGADQTESGRDEGDHVAVDVREPEVRTIRLQSDASRHLLGRPSGRARPTGALVG